MSEPSHESDIKGEQPTPPGEAAVTESEKPEPKKSAPPWVPSKPQVHRYKDPEAVADAAARRVLTAATAAVEKWDRFILVLAGGSTPRLLYQKLTEPPYRDKVPWGKTLFAFGDERAVPPDHEDSNFRMAYEALLGPLEVPEHHILRMKGEQDPTEAAQRYEVRLGDLFLLRPKRQFDLTLLGIGPDGHTASLFPGTDALEEEKHWVAANHVPKLDSWRLTLTVPALNHSRHVVFLATGEEKAEVIAEAFGGVPHPVKHPVERITGGRREVLIDHAAASKMPHHRPSDQDAPDSDSSD